MQKTLDGVLKCVILIYTRLRDFETKNKDLKMENEITPNWKLYHKVHRSLLSDDNEYAYSCLQGALHKLDSFSASVWESVKKYHKCSAKQSKVLALAYAKVHGDN